MTLADIDIAGATTELVVALLTALIIAASGGFWRLAARLKAQDIVMEANKDTLQRLESRLEREFGGNSGGIREAINGLKAAAVADTRRLDDHLESHSFGRRRDDPR